VSLRQPVTRFEIKRFLQRLGDRFRGAGRVYLVGGTTLVFEEVRRQTLDVDLAIEVAPEVEGRFIQTVRELMVELNLNVEQASPADFIPLPAGYANRHVYVGRFGQLDVFHFDPYSSALSKVSRGREQDFADVLSLLRQQMIEWPVLAASFQEILPQIGSRSLKQNPAEFEKNFSALEGLWRAAGGHP